MADHEHWLTRNRALAATGACAAYATALAIYTGGADQTWAIWAAVAYSVTTVLIWATKRTRLPLIVPLLVALAGALGAPLFWLVTRVSPTPEVQVISRSATLLFEHGTPYLPPGQLDNWLSYNPYLPVMAVFGIPRALGATGLLGDPRVWMSLVSIALIATAFWFASPHLSCGACSRNVALSTVFAAASPVIAFPLAIGITDPPVIALLLLALALAARPGRRAMWAGVVLGVASAMKATAWPAVPIFAAMMATRDGVRAAMRFVGILALTAAALCAAMAPAALSDPAAFLQNTVLFPLGLTTHKTPAASPLPGHLLAMTGPVGHLAAVGLLGLAGLGFAVSLIVRPPADARAAALRIALGLAVMFTLAPATRWGYFVYPIGLIGWVALTGRGSAESAESSTGSGSAGAEAGVEVGAGAGTVRLGDAVLGVAGAGAGAVAPGGGWSPGPSGLPPELTAAQTKK
jgi:Glycosyltransferase family 87